MADLHDLTAFLREAAAAPFEFSQWDCAMLLANWVRAQTGRDPAADLRDAYHSEIEWRLIVARKGGLARLVGTLAGEAGMHQVDEPAPGDIAVVETSLGPTGGIRTRLGFACKVARGLHIGPAVPIHAWSF